MNSPAERRKRGSPGAWWRGAISAGSHAPNAPLVSRSQQRGRHRRVIRHRESPDYRGITSRNDEGHEETWGQEELQRASIHPFQHRRSDAARARFPSSSSNRCASKLSRSRGTSRAEITDRCPDRDEKITGPRDFSWQAVTPVTFRPRNVYKVESIVARMKFCVTRCRNDACILITLKEMYTVRVMFILYFIYREMDIANFGDLFRKLLRIEVRMHSTLYWCIIQSSSVIE